MRLQKSRIARVIDVPIRCRLHATAEDRREILHGEWLDLWGSGIGHDRFGQRMFAVLLQPCSDGQQAGFLHAHGLHAGDFGAPLRDGARLVHDHGIDLARRLQRRTRLDEDAVLRPLARADHDGHRRGKA